MDPSAITPVNWNVSLGVQRDIGLGTTLDVKYVGTFGRHLYSENTMNELPWGTRFLPSSQDPTTGSPLPDSLLRPYPGWGGVVDLQPNTTSNYHALQVAASHRLAHGLMVSIAYTYSKAMDENDSDLTWGSMPEYFSLKRYYDIAGFDQTHVFSLNYTYNFPVPAGLKANKVANAVLGDWQISGVTTFASGMPTAPTWGTTNGEDLSGGGDAQWLNVSCNPKLAYSDRTKDAFFNTSCFSLPALGAVGNTSRNPIRGPGINNFDATLFRNIHVKSERNTITLRWEVYNALNHSQFSSVDSFALYTPSGQQVNGDFGHLNASRPPRVMQMSLRYAF
jgi:hypothetical protein